MATDPQIPQPQKRMLHLVRAKLPARFRPPEMSGRALLGGIVVVLILAAIFYYATRSLDHMKTQDQVESQVDPGAQGLGLLESELELSDVQMAQAPGDGRLDIYGRVLNTGNHLITRAVIQVTFKDSKGRRLPSIQKPIQGRFKEANRTLADDFPIEPDQSRFFQVTVDQVPTTWDHKIPELKVITVSVKEPRD
jgi:hypothetical protein